MALDLPHFHRREPLLRDCVHQHIVRNIRVQRDFRTLRREVNLHVFYARHGFAWDGTEEHIPFPHDMTCVDLRYTKQL